MTQTDRDTPVTALREALERNGIGGTTNDGPHSWRCDYYKDIDPAKGGGPCDCIDTLIADIRAALASSDDVAGSGERHEPDLRAPQWEREWCVVDEEDWPCAVERARRAAAPTTEAPPKDAPE